MSRPLIPNDITVSAQLERMIELHQAFDNWLLKRYNKFCCAVDQTILDAFLLDSGIKCYPGNYSYSRQLLSPSIEDEKTYLLFRLQYS